jgi:hypothetical protein
MSGEKAWLAYSVEQQDGGHVVKTLALNLNNEQTTGPNGVSDQNNSLPKPVNPELSLLSGTPTVVWWDAANSELRGARLANGSAKDRFNSPVGVDSTRTAEPVDVFASSGEVGLVYPDYSSGNAALHYLPIKPSDTGEITRSPTPLTGTGQTNRQPSARAVDSNGDGTADRLLVVWAQGATDDPAIVVGQTSLSSPGMLQGEKVKGNGDDSAMPGLAITGEQAGAVWVDTIVGNSRDAKYAPLSIDGVPICNP